MHRAADPAEAAREEVVSALCAQVLRTGAPVRVRVFGTSMLPAIWPGDVVTVRPAAVTAELRCGEIAVFRRYGRLIAHRIVEAGAGGLVTRGDAHDERDPPVRPCELVGKVAAISRRGRTGAPRRPSPAQALLTRAIRRSQRVRRLALAWHAVRLRLRPAGF
jgi:hypothetical protein